MGKSRDLFKKIRDTKGTFHAKMGSIKDRNGVDVGNLISGSSAFSKISLNIWMFTVHVLLKPGLKNFEWHWSERWLHGAGVSGHEETPHVQGQDWGLHFAQEP